MIMIIGMKCHNQPVGQSIITASDYNCVAEFEKRIAEFFGAPYGVAVDSCTHGIELCLRLNNSDYIRSPLRTYLSVPMLANKLNIRLVFEFCKWVNYYMVTGDIIDAAVFWKYGGYKDCQQYAERLFMCLSFQYQKHLSLGKGGMILTDNKEVALQLKKMSYDGRLPGIPWREQNIDTYGFHYYMTPETAQLGLDKLDEAIRTPPRLWTHKDYPDISQFKVFQHG